MTAQDLQTDANIAVEAAEQVSKLDIPEPLKQGLAIFGAILTGTIVYFIIAQPKSVFKGGGQ